MDGALRATSPTMTAQLPDELLVLVLGHFNHKPELIHLSHVSQQWRAIAHSHPCFWKIVQLRDYGEYSESPNYEFARTQVLASNNAGISIEIDICRTSCGWKSFICDHSMTIQAAQTYEINPTALESSVLLDFMTLLVSEINRISSITITATGSAYQLIHQSGLFRTIAPSLEKLELDIYHTEEHRSLSIVNLSFLDHFAPELRVLHLHYACVRGPEFTAGLHPHQRLEELVWRISSKVEPPRLDNIFAQFLSLHNLELYMAWVSNYEPGPSIQAFHARLATFSRLVLSDVIIRHLHSRQLEQVPFIAVHIPSFQTTIILLEHFSRDTASSLPELHLDLWSNEVPDEPQRMEISELCPNGRVRAFDFMLKRYPSPSQMAILSSRVTRLSIPVNQWKDIMLRLNNGPAVQELVLRFSHQQDINSINAGSEIPSMLCTELRQVTLQAAKRAHELGTIEIQLDAEVVLAFMKRVTDESVHGRMQLKLEGVRWHWTRQLDEQERDEAIRQVFSDVDWQGANFST